MLPRTVVIALRDGERPISNEQTDPVDSASQLLGERKEIGVPDRARRHLRQDARLLADRARCHDQGRGVACAAAG